MLLSVNTLLYLQIFIGGVYCQIIGPAQFESEWLTIEAQNTSSDLLVRHGLKAVPGLVEVLVRAVDGPNEGFIFKAIGNGERDDDINEVYGGVIYIYNDVKVRVMAPRRANNLNDIYQGGAIYTEKISRCYRRGENGNTTDSGESPYWRGPNSQRSLKAEVKVRCWATSALPTPCFRIGSHFMAAGSSNVDDTYAEFIHNLDEYPMLVKVRAKLIDGLDPNWYADAQGSSLISFNHMRYRHVTGGLKFAYNHERIRVWTSSYPSPDGVLFSRNDGWGNDFEITGGATTGYIDAFAWCNLTLTLEETLYFGPSVTGEVLQIPLPDIFSISQLFLTSTMIEAEDGPNRGFLFEGVGSAMTSTELLGLPCAYGGLIYAYNDTTLRIWRPDHYTGSAICIPDSMGFGTNSQASQNGKLIFRVFKAYEQAEEYVSMSLVCSHFKMLGKDTAYNSTPIDTQHDVTTLLSCDYSCRQHNTCVTYAYSNDMCNMYNTTEDALLFTKHNSQVWGLKTRAVQTYP